MLLVHIRSASPEAPRQGATNEYPQHMFLWRNKKNINNFQLKKSTLSGAIREDQEKNSKIQDIILSKSARKKPKECLKRHINNHAIIRNISYLETFQRVIDKILSDSFG